MTHKRNIWWTFAITSTALFMVTLDNLVVTTALPVIRTDLHSGLSGLEWTVNAYTLTFAVLLLTGAALGDRFGRRLMFSIGLAIFTVASAAAAVAPSIGALDAARAIQGVGGAIVMPLTLTILSAAVPAERRGLALGAWGGISGLAVAMGPLIGGAVVSGISWHWIFWLNVPIGLVLAPLALGRLDESRGPANRLDLVGVVLVSGGLFGIVWGLVRGNGVGWSSPEIVGALVGGFAIVAAFVLLGDAHREPDAADEVLPQPDVRAGEHLEPLHVLRDVRLDLPAGAVLPDRPGLLAAAVRTEDPALDGDADLRRADRRRPLRPGWRAPADGARADAAGGRARVDRGGLDAHDAVLRARAPVHSLGGRDGAVLRAGRQRGALVRRARPGGAGVGCEQRDPRARRRLRRRRARVDLRALRRLPHLRRPSSTG